MKQILAGTLIVVAVLFMFSTSNVLAQEPCNGNFDCDQDVDSIDVAEFLAHFGRSQYSNPCPLCQDSPCPCSITVPKTGQTSTWATGDDGDLEKGLIWPYPRFKDNSDGTVTDNLTNLTWLRDANCYNTRTWNNALSDCNGLASGTCGLSDGSHAGEWRLPNVKELTSLIDYKYTNPALCNTNGTAQWSEGDPFTNVVSYIYHTSSTYNLDENEGWEVAIGDGAVVRGSKAYNLYVWCVKDAIPPPPPRFTDNGDGTVTDNDSGLTWLKDAFCDDINNFGAGLNWNEATAAVSLLAAGTCGLTDGSSAGEWRLPTKLEWDEFVCTQYNDPAVCNTDESSKWVEDDPFTAISSDYYWTGSDCIGDEETHAYVIWLFNGGSSACGLKGGAERFVWPVR